MITTLQLVTQNTTVSNRQRLTLLNSLPSAGHVIATASASAASASVSASASEAARDAALLSRGVFSTTAKALSKGVVSTTGLVGGSGGTNGTFALAFSGGAGSGAAGVFTVAGGAVTSITITAAGDSYTSAPTISFAASSGLTGASATAVIADNVSAGEWFSVPVSGTNDALILYENVAGVATERVRYPSRDYVVAEVANRKAIIDVDHTEDALYLLDQNRGVLAAISGSKIDLGESGASFGADVLVPEIGLHIYDDGDPDTLIIEGKNGAVLADFSAPASSSTPSQSEIGALEDLRNALSDPARSVVVTAIGDSITWGSGATNTGPTDPRTGELTDPRSNYTAKSWPNLLRRWLGVQAGGITGEPTEMLVGATEPSGYAAYRVPGMIDVTGPAVTKGGAYTSGADASAQEDVYLDIPAGGNVSVTIYGDQISLIYKSQSADAAGVIGVSIDGGTETDTSSYNASPAYGQSCTATAGTVGSHTIRFSNKSTATLRVEALNHNRLVGLRNNGINGRSTHSWLPAYTLLAGGVPADTTHVIMQLGTNDRLDVPQRKLAANYAEIAGWIESNRPGAKIIVMAPPKAEIDYPTAPYLYSTGVVRSICTKFARDAGHDLIDNYSVMSRLEIEGTDVLPDGLHPNDAGYTEMFRNITSTIVKE